MNGHYLRTAASACLLMSAMIAGTVSFGFFMDPVTTDLGFDRSTFSLYFSLITIVGVITLPMYGKLIAKHGTRLFVIIGGAWTGLAFAAFSLCDTLPMFFLVGCLGGLGFFGCSYAVVPVIVATWFYEKNGLVMGAPLWGLAYDLTGGYQVAMYASAAIIVAAFLVVYWAITSSKKSCDNRVD